MSTALLALGGALLFPVVGLVFLLWLAYLEDTLPRDVHRAVRKPDPAPILALPVRKPAITTTTTVIIPEQRHVPEIETVGTREPGVAGEGVVA